MATPKLNLNQPAQGTTPWDSLINDNFSTLDNALINDEGVIEGIEDAILPMNKHAIYEEATLTVASNEIAWSLQDAPVAVVVMDDDAELKNPTNPPSAGYTGVYILKVEQDGSGGHTLTFDTAYRFPGGETPTNTEDANAYDIYTFYRDSDGNMNCMSALDFQAGA